MKYLFRLGILAAATLQACSWESSQPAPQDDPVPTVRARALHEQAFAANSALWASPADTLIFALEPSGTHPGDTGSEGVDRIPVRVAHTASFTLCLPDDPGHDLIVRATDGSELYRLDSGGCQDVTLTAGSELTYELHHARRGSPGDVDVVFVGPQGPGPRESSGQGLALTAAADDFRQPFNECDKYSYCCWWDPAKIDLEAERHVPCTSIARDGIQLGTVLPLPACQYQGAEACEYIQWFCEEQLLNDSDWALPCDRYAAEKTDLLRHGCTQAMCDDWKQIAQQFCEQRYAECMAASQLPQACPGAFVRSVPYRELVTTNSSGETVTHLAKGEVGIVLAIAKARGTSSCPPDDPNQMVHVLKGNCDALPGVVHGILVGPDTQAVVYEEPGYAGNAQVVAGVQPDLVRSCEGEWPVNRTGVLTCADWRRRQSFRSIAVSTLGAHDPDRCPVIQSGQWCDFGGDCGDGSASTIEYPAPGETVIVGPMQKAQGKCCAPAHLLPTGTCTDLNLIGVADRLWGVILPARDDKDPLGRTKTYPDDATGVELFPEAGQQGISREVTLDSDLRDPSLDPRGHFKPLPAEGPGPLRNKVRSLHVRPLQERNQVVLVQTNRCPGCSLSDVVMCNQRLVGTDLSGADLSRAYLSNTELVDVNLSKARLDDARLDGTTIEGADLTCVSMQRVDTRVGSSRASSLHIASEPIHGNADGSTGCRSDFGGASIPIQMLPRTSWRGFDMVGTTLLGLEDGYDLRGIDLQQANLRGLNMGGSALKMWGANLNGADLRNAELWKVNFGADCSDPQASECRITTMKDARLNGANLSYTNLWRADLTGAFLNATDESAGAYSGARLSYAFMRDTILSSAHLEGANLAYAHFYGEQASLAGTVLRSVVFANAVLSHVDFRGSQLIGTDFTGSVLVNANFASSNTTFEDASFVGAFLQGAQLAGASFLGTKGSNVFTNALLSSECATWTFRGLDCEVYQVKVGASSFPTQSTAVTCPNSETGPCTGAKLIPAGGTENTPACVPGQAAPDDPNNPWYTSPCDVATAPSQGPQTVPVCENDEQCGCLVEAGTCSAP